MHTFQSFFRLHGLPEFVLIYPLSYASEWIRREFRENLVAGDRLTQGMNLLP